MPKHKSIKKEEKGDKKRDQKGYPNGNNEVNFQHHHSSTWDGLLGIF
jgi:hypothetical protein